MSEQTNTDPVVENRSNGFGRVRRAWEKFVRAVLRPFRPTVLRVWRLGSVEDRVIPTAKAFDNMAKILVNVHPDEDCDIIWDPYLDVTVLRGAKALDIVTGPGIRVTREGNVVKVEKDEPAAGHDMGGYYGPVS